MQGVAATIRVRVDFLPPDGAAGRADVVVPADAPVAEVLPELLDVFGAAPAPGASWRVRLPDGSDADPERGLAAAGVRAGDRLSIVDDPGPVPAALVTDIADALAESVPGVGVADGWAGRTVTAAGALAVVAAALHMSATDAVLAAGVLGVCAAACALGLRIALRRGAAAPTVLLAAILLIGVSAAAGAAVTGVGAGGDWRFLAGLVPGLAVASVAVFLLRPRQRALAGATAAAGAGGVAATVFTGIAAAVTSASGSVPAAAAVLAAALVALTLAPGLCVAAAGVRVPRIPAAGEPFPEDPDPTAPVTVIAHRAGRLLDGATAAVAGFLVVSGGAVVAAADTSWTAPALVAAVVVVCVIQSRGHARTVPSGALTVAAAALLMVLAWAQWDAGRWPLALLVLAPVLAGVALPAVPANRVSPTARRALELVEAVALAVSLPLAAAVAGLPDVVGGLLR